MGYWMGKIEKCQICNHPFGNTMYDANLRHVSWANVCEPCFNKFGQGLGTGKGQKYERQEDGRWYNNEKNP